jgi:hypothetical protein
MAVITYAALACKFLIPVGYMPAPISDGWPVRMCQAGLPKSLLSHETDHLGQDETNELRWDSCSLGALYASAVIADSQIPHVPYPGSAPALTTAAGVCIETTASVFHCRAPPTSTI